MNRKHLTIFAFVTFVLFLAGIPFGYANTTPPASPVKLVFIHHSTGGNWLADQNSGGPYGELAKALMNNNYYVSATNYGWGPNAIGDTTDILDWPNWFTNATVMNAVYTTTDQSFLDYGSWTRMSADPGGQNVIVMFKSCFPNAEMYGSPDDPAASTPDGTLNVANAKAVYNLLLSYFETRQDKLFVVITNPPLREEEYNSDPDLTVAQRAANARAFTNWLVNDWLSGYAHNNVAVFNYFNVLTGANNHHQISDSTGQPENVTNDANSFAYYPSGDSHPNTAGHTKATAEFVPILNYYYNLWAASGPVLTDTDGDGTPNTSDPCWTDPNKVTPGVCGCSIPDTDTDADGTPDCNDDCPNDPLKIVPGNCGCGSVDADPCVPAVDTDGDGTPDGQDGCPDDPNKTAPGDCGCGVAEGTCDQDTDGDGTPDAQDGCPNDANKTAPGDCGCGVAEGTCDQDTDGDGTPDGQDGCPNDANKTAPGDCGCGVAEGCTETGTTDTDDSGGGGGCYIKSIIK